MLNVYEIISKNKIDVLRYSMKKKVEIFKLVNAIPTFKSNVYIQW